jgi:hypothetical protein
VTAPPVSPGLANLEPLERETIILVFHQQTQRQIAESSSFPGAPIARTVSIRPRLVRYM